jgi:hypothetical protein
MAARMWKIKSAFYSLTPLDRLLPSADKQKPFSVQVSVRQFVGVDWHTVIAARAVIAPRRVCAPTKQSNSTHESSKIIRR